MEEMMRMYAPDMPSMGTEATLILNTASPIITRLSEDGYKEGAEKVAKYVYSLAVLSHRALTADEMKAFLADSYDILSGLA